jgi:1-acyl-sn-glycerol-3-phosphate acyltransferase
MSKKDKDKRKKGDSGRDIGSAWMGDLRRKSEAPSVARPDEDAGDPFGAAPLTHRSTATRVGDLPPEARFPPLRPVTIEDLSEDGLADIAPIGPTEYAGLSPETAAAEAVRPSGSEGSLPRAGASMDQLARQIRDLEARLDDMIAHGGQPPARAATTAGAAVAWPPVEDSTTTSIDEAASGPNPRAPAEPVLRDERDAPLPTSAIATSAIATSAAPTSARDLLPQDYYVRQWGRAGRRQRAEEVDEFGHDPKYEARFLPFFDFLYKTYFRVEAEGIQHIPAEGRCLVVANHSGGPLPYDGIMLRTTVRREQEGRAASPRELRWLAEDFVYHLPFVGTAMNRLGAVRACQENAERLLAAGNLVAVFPEGAKGVGKLFRERYRLQRFGRGGFIRLCLRTQTPLVPAAIVGAEEANPMLYRVEYMTKALGIPYLPITPTFPALGPLGLLPAPTKWKVIFGEPVDFGDHGPEAADDDLLVGRLAERVRVTIQAMLDRALAGRQSIWFG